MNESNKNPLENYLDSRRPSWQESRWCRWPAQAHSHLPMVAKHHHIRVCECILNFVARPSSIHYLVTDEHFIVLLLLSFTRWLSSDFRFCIDKERMVAAAAAQKRWWEWCTYLLQIIIGTHGFKWNSYEPIKYCLKRWTYTYRHIWHMRSTPAQNVNGK